MNYIIIGDEMHGRFLCIVFSEMYLISGLSVWLVMLWNGSIGLCTHAASIVQMVLRMIENR